MSCHIVGGRSARRWKQHRAAIAAEDGRARRRGSSNFFSSWNDLQNDSSSYSCRSSPESQVSPFNNHARCVRDFREANLRHLSSRELLEMLTLAVSHAHVVQDNTCIEHLEQIKDGVIEVLQEHRHLEQRMTQRMLSVCVLRSAD